jgi:CheY-like chemotaxis protein
MARRRRANNCWHTPPAVVLLDLQMPGESGYELLAWMRRQPALLRCR